MDPFNTKVTLDIKIPQMDGHEMYARLKKEDGSVKICFLTTSEMPYGQYRKQEYDAIDKDLFMRKSVSNKELVEKINRILSTKE